jgi:hypothetical protein
MSASARLRAERFGAIRRRLVKAEAIELDDR